jgi:hypothetical protein
VSEKSRSPGCPTADHYEELTMPIILWLLGVPVTLVLLLWFFGIVGF